MKSIKMIFTLLLLICLIAFSSASWGEGSCKPAEFKKDVSLKDYLGTWYEIARDSTFFFESGRCAQAHYSTIEGETYFRVANSEVDENDEWSTSIGQGRPQANGALEVRFSSFSPWSDYEIIDTDYETFSIVHSCSSFEVIHQDLNWILARSPDYQPTQEQIDMIIDLGTDEKDMVFTDQQNCPPYPADRK